VSKTDFSDQDEATLITLYQSTSKLLRNRAIFMGTLFIIMVGLFRTVESNTQKRWAYYHVKYDMRCIVESDSMLATFDSVLYGSLMNEHYYNSGFSSERFNLLRYELSKSNFKDPAPIYAVIRELDTLEDAIGDKLENYQISVLGFTTSIAYWIYLSPIILLLLYHDFTMKIFYRRGLREKLKKLNVAGWKLGAELFGFEFDSGDTPVNRFIKIITSVFVSTLLLLPLIPALYGVYFYMNETSAEDFSPALIFILWLCPLIISIDIILVYYVENLLAVRHVTAFFAKILGARATITAAVLSGIYSFSIFALLTFVSHFEYEYGFIDYGLAVTLLITLSILPFSIYHLAKKWPNKWFRAGRIVGRVLNAYWTFICISFFGDSTLGFDNYRSDVWIGGAWIVFFSMLFISLIYVWVFSAKEHPVAENHESKDESRD
jgi:hypothetical protein